MCKFFKTEIGEEFHALVKYEQLHDSCMHNLLDIQVIDNNQSYLYFPTSRKSSKPFTSSCSRLYAIFFLLLPVHQISHSIISTGLPLD
jgi:hypothetical protein